MTTSPTKAELLAMLQEIVNRASPAPADSTGQEMVKFRAALLEKARNLVARATKLPTWAEIEAVALADAESRFAADGESFATPEEMSSIREDVMAYSDLFVTAIAEKLGVYVKGPLSVQRVGDLFGSERVELGRAPNRWGF